jgi:hypothetical protein
MIRKFRFFEGIIEDTYVFENIDMIARHVAHGERTLRAVWSPQTADDLNTLHSIDAEAELTRILNEEIGRSIVEEIDNQILRELTDISNDYDPIPEITRRINGGNRA